MGGETFYTFLGGPRTFYGDGKTRFDYMRWQSTPFLNFGGQCCSYPTMGMSKTFMDLMKWDILSKTVTNGIYNIANAIRGNNSQQYNPLMARTFYPYVNFSSDSQNEDLINANKLFNNKYNITEIKGTYYANVGGKVIQADTLEDLLTNISELSNKKPTTTTDNDEISINPSQQPENVDTVEGGETVEGGGDETLNGGDDTIHDPVDPPAAQNHATVPQGWNYENATAYLNNKPAYSDYQNHTTIKTYRDLILKRFADKPDYNYSYAMVSELCQMYGLKLPDDNDKTKSEIARAIKDANPSVFKENGAFVDGLNEEILKKLDLPGKNELLKYSGLQAKNGNTNTSSTKGKYCSNIEANGKIWGSGIKYGNSNNCIVSEANGIIAHDAIFIINNRQYKIVCISDNRFKPEYYKTNFAGRLETKGNVYNYIPPKVGDFVDLSNLMRENTCPIRNTDQEIMQLDADNNEVKFLSNWPNKDAKFYFYDNEYAGAYMYLKNGVTTLHTKDNKEYNMNDVMAGIVNPNI